MIRTVKLKDADEITKIYNYYILNSIVTFEKTPIDAEEIKKRIINITSKYPWVVYENNNQVLGYAYASKWKSRCAYKHSVESTVYLKPDEMNQGIGSMLYHALINQLKDMNVHAVIGGIALPNESSIHLHEKFGFEKIGHFKEVGNKFSKWVDVGYWELIINNKRAT